MHIIIHDYSGHPFQVQLSRELSRRGHRIQHWYCASYSTGHGKLKRVPGDPDSFSIKPLSMGSDFSRYSPFKRVAQELTYGLQLGWRLARARADVAIICNTPLLAHLVAAQICQWAGTPMIFWQQDLYSCAIGLEAKKALGAVGVAVAFLADLAERRVARASRRIVAISELFSPTLSRWGVADRVEIIPNWADIHDLKPHPKDNSWSRSHGVHARPVVLYSGTLGIKHDPALLACVASKLGSLAPTAIMVVISEGKGRDWLEDFQARYKLPNLLLLDYQPYSELSDVLSAADILLCALDPAASNYSIPSKVLTYLCTGRAVLGVLPPDNPAAKVILSSGGTVVAPNDCTAAATALKELLSDPARRAVAGLRARCYAEQWFDVEGIAAHFENVAQRTLSPQQKTSASRAAPCRSKDTAVGVSHPECVGPSTLMSRVRCVYRGTGR